MLKRSEECKKLARGQQNEEDRRRAIEGGGRRVEGRIKTGACRRTVTREGERKNREGRPAEGGKRATAASRKGGRRRRRAGEAERGTRNWQARENLGR